jgi:hypothetical protein
MMWKLCGKRDWNRRSRSEKKMKQPDWRLKKPKIEKNRP